MEICPVCGESPLETHRDHTYTFKYGRNSCTVEGLLHSVCDSCGTSLFLPGQMDANNQRVREVQSRLKDYISPFQVLELREKYDLTQADAAKIFGGGVMAFSKYERGLNHPALGTARRMLQALHEPEFMRSMANAQGVQIKVSSYAVGAPVHSNKYSSIGDYFPPDVRSKIESYAANVKLSIQDAVCLLVRKSLAMEEQVARVNESTSRRHIKVTVRRQRQTYEVNTSSLEPVGTSSNVVVMKPDWHIKQYG